MTDDTLLDAIRHWVEVETPTGHVAGLTRLVQMVAADYAAIGAETEIIAGTGGQGPHLIARLNAGTSNAGILILSHLDTVHPVGTLADFPFQIKGDRAFGPGIYDMKAGAYIAMQAAGAAARSGTLSLPITHLFVSDEEIGSPTSQALIEDLARRSKYVLVTEPAREGGQIVIARKGVFRYRADAFGRPAHSGARHQDGRSAIAEIARLTLAFEALTDYDSGTTVNVGMIGGGTAANVVPAHAYAEIDLRVDNLAAARAVEDFVAGYRPHDPDVRLQITGGLNRPPYETSPAIQDLFTTAATIAQDIGFTLKGLKTGGGSDGNFTAALAPTLDGLGADGAGGHTLEEYIRVSSLTERLRLLQGLMERLT
ncbi:M20 family peptidase (plasmid) [Ketogulonicigenium vulgare Y25]|uniref:Peptidase dimerization domain protein n=1 Tax=Ketogulonicigenium vulgare (strain WSH-001) TaxID=759362 RepID=F9YBR6_KETVW|nr:M20 family metallopeptidase [Ketogulonicigenium vulgare]ADO44382.1 M20 family peptidase [Ketogulonicigenium vulgare Y25]AEM42818.1 peptidase dimerization domain protein [Ketogulonicigenium vulgare WSH-001]ALJ82753.1 carboxypeptidase [Ketogulonicigenium vulgare]